MNRFLGVTAFISGAAVIMIEMLGTRVLGPRYGVSLYLWSALISITLAALAAGYAVGGRLADRRPDGVLLAWLLLLPGAWMLLLPWVAMPIADLCFALGLRAGVLTAALVLFAPPLAALGMLSPLLVRLRVREVGETGRAAGALGALSAAGSVGAALLTGFVLIPRAGVRVLMLAVGALLVLAAAGAFTRARHRLPAGGALVLLLFLPLGLLHRDAPAKGVLETQQSAYGELRVFEDNGTRYLLIDGAVHSMAETAGLRNAQTYAAALEIAMVLRPRPGRLLLVGLGGGGVARRFAAAGWRVDAVEIDSAVTGLARRFFGLRESEARVLSADGRAALAADTAVYDLIVMDAYGSAAMPFHLTTRETFALAAARLAPEGLLFLNVETVGWHSRLLYSLAATLRTALPEVRALPVGEPPGAPGNVLLMASRAPVVLPEGALPTPLDAVYDSYEHWRVVAMNHAWDNRFAPVSTNVAIITDDRNPTDIWAEAVNVRVREQLRTLLPPDAFAR
jgi:spermidine synthase